MGQKTVFTGQGSGQSYKRLFNWYWLLVGVAGSIALVYFLPKNIVGALIFGVCAAVGLFVYYIYKKDSSRELGGRTAELDDAGITVFYDNDKAWTVGWDDIAGVEFRPGDKYGQYGWKRDIELVITDRQDREHVLSQFDDLPKDRLQELFTALKARLEGKEVRFGAIEDIERREPR